MEFSNVIAPEDMLQNFGTYPEINPLAIGLSFLLIFRELFFFWSYLYFFSLDFDKFAPKQWQETNEAEDGKRKCYLFSPSHVWT